MTPDYGTKYTDAEVEKVKKKLEGIYKQAQKEINQKMADFDKKYGELDKKYLAMVNNGQMSADDYSKWIDGKIFVGEQWNNKKKQITEVLYNSNKTAVDIITEHSFNVFAENANFKSYSMEHGAGINFGFGVYDSNAVAKLIKDNPKILPPKKLNAAKDKAWNMKKIRSSVTQSIIQGENINSLAKRLAKDTGNANYKAMMTHARTAMTSAQNAGRYESLLRAKKMGIDVYKEWMATLDARTRDSHAHLDGERQKVGDIWHPHKFSNGLRYPGDPDGPASEVYNCRCTLVGDVNDYPADYERYDQLAGKPIKNMTYQEWKKLKEQQQEIDKLGPLDDAQKVVQKLEYLVNSKNMNKTFSNIWKEDVTYADWEEKKDSIQGKKDYFEQQIKSNEELFIKHALGYDEDMYEEGKDVLNNLKKYVETADQKYKDILINEHGFDYSDINDLLIMYGDDFALKKVNKFKGLLEDLSEFEKYGPTYSKVLKRYDEAKEKLTKIQMAQLDKLDKFSVQRKNMAIWAKSPKEADDVLRTTSGKVWREATTSQKDAIYDYTVSFHKFNEPLRGYEYGTGRYLGVGKTDLNAGYANNGNALNKMTEIIDKSSYDRDQWFQRGTRFGGMDKFLQCDMDLLRYGTQEELERELLGKNITEYGFMSMGSSKGMGFSGDILLNIYAPSGTKMMYVEPFSGFGNGSGRSWDGISPQSSFGTELETILQQNTQFVIRKIEREGTYGTIYIDLDVVGQGKPQLYKE